ncbi:hypothetical protein DPMN_184017 [Dreissena polymorpha]|uniref:Transmembrane protein n=1 Tax=Dreissena polymorpha TaxID=45954 RepID=A0A9D4DHP7_DREPO|nr:hypothetical protein DPMN_184017 [Dreissena polymorpha]
MHTCFKNGIVHDIASSLASYHPNVSTCGETETRKSAEAFVLNSCIIVEPSTWIIVLNVSSVVLLLFIAKLLLLVLRCNERPFLHSL